MNHTTRGISLLLAALAVTTPLQAEDLDLDDAYDLPSVQITAPAGVFSADLVEGRISYQGHASGWQVRSQVDAAALGRLRDAWDEAKELSDPPSHGPGGIMANTVVELDYPDDPDSSYIDPYEPTAQDLLRLLRQQATWLRQPAGQPGAVSLAVFEADGGARVLEFDGSSLRMTYELGGYVYPLQAPKSSGLARAWLRHKLRRAQVDTGISSPLAGGFSSRKVELRFRDGTRTYHFASDAAEHLPERSLVRQLERLLAKATPITLTTQPAQVINRQAWIDSQTPVSSSAPLEALLFHLDGAQVLLRVLRQEEANNPIAVYLLAHEDGKKVLAVGGLSPDPDYVIALPGSVRPAFPLPSLIDADGYRLGYVGDLEFDWSGQQLPQDGPLPPFGQPGGGIIGALGNN